MDIKEFLTVFGSFGSISMESDLINTNQKIDYLLDTCESIKESEIARYIYAEGDKSRKRIERLQQQIWNSCRYMVLSSDTIIRHYLLDAFGVTVKESADGPELFTEADVSGLTVDVSFDGPEQITVATVLDPHSIERERRFVSFTLPESIRLEWESYLDNYATYSRIRLGEIDPTAGPEIKSGTPGYLYVNFEAFKEEIHRISKTGHVVLDVINTYLSYEKDRSSGRSVVDFSEAIAPIIDGNVFNEPIDGAILEDVFRMKDKHNLTIQNEMPKFWAQILWLMFKDGPKECRNKEWIKRIASNWNMINSLKNRVYEPLGYPTADVMNQVREVVIALNGVKELNIDKKRPRRKKEA